MVKSKNNKKQNAKKMQSPSSKLIPKHDSLLFFPFTYVLVGNYFPLSSFVTLSKRMQSKYEK
jgi:hypothetical protein